ncbi:BNR repeat-containing protein [Christiangramia crocea]|uniref:BNR repeat-containing protein n=1 Tax=Christiangramia crocea TaxID=2904124 RepID=A0A9X2A724_9FLAO|nr:BNR repeat-containing protein [Gramella crocea]MCG9972854.1 BNR repeat-containing protein [Gramella crocea]
MKKLLLLTVCLILTSCSGIKTTTSEVGKGWAKNSVNTVIFRKNAIISNKNYQFTAYYDNSSNLILAKRRLDKSTWEVHKTRYKGNSKDAHNAISIALDGDGYLHVSWDHHDTNLRYAISKKPSGLELGNELKMTGKLEEKVSYPQFYKLPNGNLLFMYRSGQSGRGSLVLNRFNNKTKTWEQIHENLINGEEQRNAYWQATVDRDGNIHLSWVWRESWDVATNHDLAYAVSKDNGQTWERSDGEKYELPITAATAEYAWKIPQNSNLINQTSMTTDRDGNPYIASYWNEGGKTQYHLVYLENGEWKKENTGFRKTSFDLSGGGTKKIPISRPEIMVNSGKAYLLFRDAERDNKISLAYKNISKGESWKIKDLTSYSVGEWEPNYDLELFSLKKELHIFVQNVSQMDSEGLSTQEPTPVKILKVKSLPKK